MKEKQTLQIPSLDAYTDHFWLWMIYKFVADGMQNI